MSSIFEGMLLVSDIDGTLTAGDSIPQRNIDAIHYFEDNGGLFGIATGRAIRSAMSVVGGIRFNAPCIMSNGSVLYDAAADKVIWDATLAPRYKEIVRYVMGKYPEAGVQGFDARHLYVLRKNAYTDEFLRCECVDYDVEISIDEIDTPLHKVIFIDDEQRIIDMEKDMEQYHEDAWFVRSSTIFLEMLPNHVSKGAALKALADIVGIDMKNTAAIGDFYNDRELIRTAGIGAFTAEAPEELKAVADMVVCGRSDGAVADFIEKLEQMRKAQKGC